MVYGQTSSSPPSTNTTRLPTPERITIRLITWSTNSPYYMETRSNKPVEERGIVPDIISSENLLPYCKSKVIEFNVIDEKTDYLRSHTQLYNIITEIGNETVAMRRFKMTGNSTDIVVVSATSAQVDTQNSIFKRRLIVKSQSLSVLVPTSEVTVLKKFYTGITDCCEIMILAVFLCVTMASITWLIEYLARNPDFPPTFGEGICVSFWFCFITMTSIGFSKKIQKHFLTKLLILVWMMFALLLTGMITATMMISIQKAIPISEKQVAVISSSEEKHQVSKLLFGIPKEYETHNEIITALLNGSVSAALIETNTAAVILKEHHKDVFLQQQIPYQTKIFAYVYIPDALGHCHDNANNDENTIQERVDRVRAKYVPPFQVTTYYCARKFLEIFETSHDKGVLFYLGVATASIIVMAIFSEIVAKLCEKRRAARDDVADKFKSSSQYKRIRELEKTFQTIIANMLAEELNHYNVKQTNNPSYFVMSNAKTKM